MPARAEFKLDSSTVTSKPVSRQCGRRAKIRPSLIRVFGVWSLQSSAPRGLKAEAVGYAKLVLPLLRTQYTTEASVAWIDRGRKTMYYI